MQLLKAGQRGTLSLEPQLQRAKLGLQREGIRGVGRQRPRWWVTDERQADGTAAELAGTFHFHLTRTFVTGRRRHRQVKLKVKLGIAVMDLAVADAQGIGAERQRTLLRAVTQQRGPVRLTIGLAGEVDLRLNQLERPQLHVTGQQGTDAQPGTQRVERQQRRVGCPVGVGDAQVAKLHAQRQAPFDVEFADGHRAPVQALAQLALDQLPGPG